MSLLEKLRTGQERAAAAAAPTKAAPAPAAEATSPDVSRRQSNGLKDFLWNAGDARDGRLLDVGRVAQSTVSFFTERSFKVYTEDLLRAWKEHLAEEESRLRKAPLRAEAAEAKEFSMAAIAERFMAANLVYSEGTFHAVLLWDVLDYMDMVLLPLVVNRLYDLLRPGGVVLGLFHSKPADAFYRYRVCDTENIEMVRVSPLLGPPHLFQNRELMNLFARFRSSKTFVGRDQIREALFLK
jgi:hypothetical protein